MSSTVFRSDLYHLFGRSLYIIPLVMCLQVIGPADFSNFDSYPKDMDVPQDEMSGWDADFWSSCRGIESRYCNHDGQRCDQPSANWCVCINNHITYRTVDQDGKPCANFVIARNVSSSEGVAERSHWMLPMLWWQWSILEPSSNLETCPDYSKFSSTINTALFMVFQMSSR